MTLQEKLKALRGDPSEWIGGFLPQRINESEWNALIDVVLAAEDCAQQMLTEDVDREIPGIGMALTRLDRALS